MSGETVTSRNSLQFTNDNKNAYAYSGLTVVSQSLGDVTMFEGSTNSEYIKATVSFGTADATFSGAKNIGYKISFNDTLVFSQLSISDGDGTLNYDGACFPQTLIIPPFTTIKIETFTSDADTIETFAMINGKVGMPQRVGNLDE